MDRFKEIEAKLLEKSSKTEENEH